MKSQRNSGPLLDRIDIHIEVLHLDYEKLSGARVGEPSGTVCLRVQAAGNIRQARFMNPNHRTSNNGSSPDIVCNAGMRGGDPAVLQIARRRTTPDAGGNIVLCMSQLNLSARTYRRMLKLARTIGDLVGCGDIQSVSP